jgi:hypothetical protein
MSTKSCAATTSNGAGREWRFVASIWWMHSLIACEVLPENPWVKEKMLAKTWGVRPGLRSDNGAARRGLPTFLQGLF